MLMFKLHIKIFLGCISSNYQFFSLVYLNALEELTLNFVNDQFLSILKVFKVNFTSKK